MRWLEQRRLFLSLPLSSLCVCSLNPAIRWIEIEMVPSFFDGASCGATFRTCPQGSSQVAFPCFHVLPRCLVGIVGSFCLLYGTRECTSTAFLPFSWFGHVDCGSIQEQFCLSEIDYSKCAVLFGVLCVFLTWTCGFLSLFWSGRSRCESIPAQSCSRVNACKRCWVQWSHSAWRCKKVPAFSPRFHYLPFGLVCTVSSFCLKCGCCENTSTAVLFGVLCVMLTWTFGFLSLSWFGRSKCESIPAYSCLCVNSCKRFWVNWSCSVWRCLIFFVLAPRFYFLPIGLVCIVSSFFLLLGYCECTSTAFLSFSWCGHAEFGSIQEQFCSSEISFTKCFVLFGVPGVAFTWAFGSLSLFFRGRLRCESIPENVYSSLNFYIRTWGKQSRSGWLCPSLVGLIPYLHFLPFGFVGVTSSQDHVSLDGKVLECRASQTRTVFARPALIIGRRRYRRPSGCTLAWYCRRRASRAELLERQCGFLLSCYVLIMVFDLDQFPGVSSSEVSGKRSSAEYCNSLRKSSSCTCDEDTCDEESSSNAGAAHGFVSSELGSFSRLDRYTCGSGAKDIDSDLVCAELYDLEFARRLCDKDAEDGGFRAAANCDDEACQHTCYSDSQGDDERSDFGHASSDAGQDDPEDSNINSHFRVCADGDDDGEDMCVVSESSSLEGVGGFDTRDGVQEGGRPSVFLEEKIYGLADVKESEYQQCQMQVCSGGSADAGVRGPQGGLADIDSTEPKDEMLCVERGLRVDPTHDYDADDFQLDFGCTQEARFCGIRGRSSLLPEDGVFILRTQRLGLGVRSALRAASQSSRNSSAMYSVMDECRFVPDEVLAWLICHVPDGDLLHRLLFQPWVPDWHGWQEYLSKRGSSGCSFREDVWVDDLLQQFLATTMVDVVLDCPSDAEMKKLLLKESIWDIREGDSFSRNSLTDSILQGLVFHNLIDTVDSANGEIQWRRELCQGAREYLCAHEDEWFRPKQ